MIVAFWAAVGKVALKVLQFLVGDKKGRKFLGYVIGIALFIVLIPVIALYGLFGWMSGGEVAEIVGYDAERDVNDLMLERLDAVYKSPVSVFVQAEQLGFEVETAECPTLESASCAFPFVRDNARAAAIDEAFSTAIKEMIEDGTMKALSEEWLGMDVTCYEPLFGF